MKVNLYASFFWIFIRVLIHMCVISTAVLLAYLKIQMDAFLYVFLVVFALVYVLIVIAQRRVPLVSVDENKLIVNNFFYKGRQEFNIDNVTFLSLKGNNIYFLFGKKKLYFSTLGISSKNREIFYKELENFLVRIRKTQEPVMSFSK
mgnify:CR=1 FL=1